MNLSDGLRESAHCIRHDLGVGSFVDLEPDNADSIDLAADELDRLTSALPKTADGVTIVPGMRLVHLDGTELVADEITRHRVVSFQTATRPLTLWNIGDLYSTRQAAEEAAKSQ